MNSACVSSSGAQASRSRDRSMLYKGAQVGDDFKADAVVAEQLMLEIKSVATILAVHEMQLRTYLRMSGIRVGLLLNFTSPQLMDGLRRYVHRTIKRSERLCSGTRPCASCIFFHPRLASRSRRAEACRPP
jgi:GxxExxY protein